MDVGLKEKEQRYQQPKVSQMIKTKRLLTFNKIVNQEIKNEKLSGFSKAINAAIIDSNFIENLQYQIAQRHVETHGR